MSRIHLQHLGRWGNTMFGVAFALGFAEKTGRQLTIDPWIGTSIFDLPESVTVAPTPEGIPVLSEHDLGKMPLFQIEAFAYRSYSQCQKCADFYTQRQLRSWFRFKPDIAAACEAAIAHHTHGGAPDKIVCHLRRGDFKGYGYPLVSMDAYRNAFKHYGFDWGHPGIAFLSDEDPTPHLDPILDGFPFIVDFYRMMKAPVLLRANSSFSFWSGALSTGIVLSPFVEGCRGGEEHDVRFVNGLWPRLSDHDFVTDLFISP